MSNSVHPHRWQPTRLPRSWDSPGKNTGVGCHFLLQCMKVKSESEVAQSYWGVRLLATPWTAAYQAPSSMGFSSTGVGSHCLLRVGSSGIFFCKVPVQIIFSFQNGLFDLLLSGLNFLVLFLVLINIFWMQFSSVQFSHSVVSDSTWPHGLQPTRLLYPWDLPGKSTGVGCHCLLWIHL